MPFLFSEPDGEPNLLFSWPSDPLLLKYKIVTQAWNFFFKSKNYYKHCKKKLLLSIVSSQCLLGVKGLTSMSFFKLWEIVCILHFYFRTIWQSMPSSCGCHFHTKPCSVSISFTSLKICNYSKWMFSVYVDSCNKMGNRKTNIWIYINV